MKHEKIQDSICTAYNLLIILKNTVFTASNTGTTRNQIGQVRYINILTWIRSFQGKLLYLVLFSLHSSLFWELRYFLTNVIVAFPTGGYCQKNWVGISGQLPNIFTLFMSKICDFPYLIYDLTKRLDSLFMTVAAGTAALNIIYEELLLMVLSITMKKLKKNYQI